MSNLLKAMGFWMWGLIAIGLSLSLVSVSYRMLSVYRSHDLSASSQSSEAGSKAEVAAPPALFSDNTHEPVISRAIAKEISAAQKSMQAGQWSEALRDLEAAGQNAPLSAYDTKTIEDFRGTSYVRLNNLRAAQRAYEAALATGAYKEEELVKIFRLLFQVAATNQQPAKAIEYGEKANDLGALKSNDLVIMSQIYYQEKDCKNSGVWGDRAIAAFKKEREAPKEVLYQLKLQCASDANDAAAMIAVLSDLVRLTNKASYWNNLIRLERQDERDDRNLLMIYRVMYDTNSMQADTDYIEMAQLLGDAALPGEATMVLEKAMNSGIVKDDHKERTNRLLNAMQMRADAEKKGLPALDAEASRNPAGQLDVKLGEVYFGTGDYQGASTAITRGLGKGQITQLDEAYVYLARDWMAQRNPTDAKKILAQLRALPNISPRVLRLWNLYADTIPEARSASL